MSNVYDVFKARKEGYSSLCEGFNPELEDVVLEGFSDPVEYMDQIMEESAMDFMELQSAIYVNDLVLETAMFENFDEENISELMEASMKDRLTGLGESIKKHWAKLTAWFKETIVNIQNFFTGGEKLVEKYGENTIASKIKACEVKATMNEYVDAGTAIGRCNKLIENVRAVGTAKAENVSDAKSKILSAAGASDKAGVAKTVRAAFIVTEKPVEKKISSLNPKIVIDYVKNKKDIIDSINKAKSNFDKEFNEILSILKKEAGAAQGEYKSTATDSVAIFNFAIAVKTTILNAEISCVKKGSSDNKAIIMKAIGGQKAGDAANSKDGSFSKEDSQKLKGSLKYKQMAKNGAEGKGFVMQPTTDSLQFDEISFNDEF